VRGIPDQRIVTLFSNDRFWSVVAGQYVCLIQSTAAAGALAGGAAVAVVHDRNRAARDIPVYQVAQVFGQFNGNSTINTIMHRAS